MKQVRMYLHLFERCVYFANTSLCISYLDDNLMLHFVVQKWSLLLVASSWITLIFIQSDWWLFVCKVPLVGVLFVPTFVGVGLEFVCSTFLYYEIFFVFVLRIDHFGSRYILTFSSFSSTPSTVRCASVFVHSPRLFQSLQSSRLKTFLISYSAPKHMCSAP